MKKLLAVMIGFCMILFSCQKETIQSINGTIISNTSNQLNETVSTKSDGLNEGVATCTNVINSNFNGTPINSGNYIWFHSHIKLTNPPSKTTFTLKSISSSITFFAAGVNYTLNVPDAIITFSNAATSPTNSFINNTWVTTIPLSQINNDEIFLTGLAFKVPSIGLPGGINPVNWNVSFTSDAPGGLSLQWQWSAAVYTNLVSNNKLDYNKLGVVLVHSSVHSGTPVNFEKYVIGGCRGGGGGNYTGSWSATGFTYTCNIPARSYD